MIWQFQQSEGFNVHKPPPRSPEERQYDPMEDAAMDELKVFIAFLLY